MVVAVHGTSRARSPAIALIADIACIDRFPNAKHFSSYLRSTPSVDSSNEVIRIGRTNNLAVSYLLHYLLSLSAILKHEIKRVLSIFACGTTSYQLLVLKPSWLYKLPQNFLPFHFNIFSRPMLKVYVPKELAPGEARVGLAPDSIKKLKVGGFQVTLEKGAGEASSYSDAEYKKNGALISASKTDIKKADIIVKVRPPLQKGQNSEAEAYKKEAFLISFQEIQSNQKNLRIYKKKQTKYIRRRMDTPYCPGPIDGCTELYGHDCRL